MKARGFTLLELMIVLVLIGISAIFSTRFIADMASSYVGTAQRSQALAGARFAMERIKRELGLAYSPSVYVSDDKRCVSFVPVLAAGSYSGGVTSKNATFIIPLTQQGNEIKDVHLAVRADSDKDEWQKYPEELLPNVVKLKNQTLGTRLPFTDASNPFDTSASFIKESTAKRYVLLPHKQVRFCLQGSELRRAEKLDSEWVNDVLMLSNIKGNSKFTDYNETLQLLVVSLSLQTRDGELVLPSQIQVAYAP